MSILSLMHVYITLIDNRLEKSSALSVDWALGAAGSNENGLQPLVRFAPLLCGLLTFMRPFWILIFRFESSLGLKIHFCQWDSNPDDSDESYHRSKTIMCRICHFQTNWSVKKLIRWLLRWGNWMNEILNGTLFYQMNDKKQRSICYDELTLILKGAKLFI